MNITLPIGILLFFLATALGSFFPLLKQVDFKQLKLSISTQEAKSFLAVLIAISALLAARVVFSAENALANAAIFAAAVSLPFLLRRANLPYEVLRLVLLVVVVLLTFLSASLPNFALLSILLGLLTYKVMENLLFSNENRLDDILPPCIWLAVFAWAAMTGRNWTNIENILLSCLSITLLLRLFPASLIVSDRYFVKRIIISISGGLALLLVLTKLLLMPKMAVLAALFGAGLFFSFLLRTGRPVRMI